MKKLLSLLISCSMLLLSLPSHALAYSDAYGSEVWQEDIAVHHGVTFHDNIYWSHYYEQLRHEYFVTVAPDSPITPAVAYGDSVCARLTATEAAEMYEAQGWRVVAGINGDFYDTATGYPLGVMISDGEIISGAENNYALGFLPDGSVLLGEPKLAITAQHEDRTLPIAAINKPRVEDAGVTLLTSDFNTDHTTGTHTEGLTVLCSIVSGSASMGDTLHLRVDHVETGAQAVEIGEQQVALTISENGYTVHKYFLEQLAVGNRFTISFTPADSRWNSVTEAIGALYLLVENGTVKENLSTTYAPRSVVGVKANGELVLYTVDGRQAEHSMGASLRVLAQRMVELGCETAVCLDGGGSTTMTATLPGAERAQVVNSPSDKMERKVSNHLLLLVQDYSTGIGDHLYFGASSYVVLPGHTVELSAQLLDSNFSPMDAPILYQCSAGEVIDGIFYAPDEGGPVTITASVGGFTEQIQILVVDTPDEIHVYWEGVQVDGVTMVPGDTAQLSVTASYNHRKLETFNSDFTWRVDNNLGSFDENGLLTTKFTEGTGTASISKGDLTVVISLTLDGRSPFVDTAGHWGTGYLCSLYHKGVLTGVQQGDALYANPDKGVTRAEFAVLLARFMNLNTDDYADITTPFMDMEQVDAWAANAVRAMYALGIVGGIEQSDGTLLYAPQATLSRSQAVTMLGRARNAEALSADLSMFPDTGEILDYARAHFETMVALGVMNGNNGKLYPNNAMTRAEICKVLAILP